MPRPLTRSDALITRYSHVAPPLLRLGLGLTILFAGAHKLIAPGGWHAYLAAPLLDLWPTALIPLDPAFVLFGVSEVGVGLLLLADWHTPTVAAVTALSLVGVVGNLIIGLAWGQTVADILIRDLGLSLLAAGVALADFGSDPTPS